LFEGVTVSPPERSTITAIEPQVKHPDRVSVFVDGEWVLGMHAEVAAAAGLQVGQAMTVSQLQALTRSEEGRRVRESALAFLGYRARSRAELRRRLQRKGYDPELVEETLEGLARSGLINDAEFSQSWVRARTGSRPMGPNRLAAELRQKGVDRDLIDQALEAVNPDVELDLALEVGRRKVEQLRGEDVQSARRKLAASLMRRGFSWDICARVLDIVLSSDE
jgi:regulatory protein